MGERASRLETEHEIGEGAWDQREAPRTGRGAMRGEGRPRLGRERKLGGRLEMSGGLGFGGQSPGCPGECGDNPKVGRGPGWRWVSELGRGHWEPRLREGTQTLERRRGHPDVIWGAPELGIPVSELRHPRILSGDSQFANERRNPGWTAAGRGALQISLSPMEAGLPGV